MLYRWFQKEVTHKDLPEIKVLGVGNLEQLGQGIIVKTLQNY
jgi:hypothetical protein